MLEDALFVVLLLILDTALLPLAAPCLGHTQWSASYSCHRYCSKIN